MSPAYLQAVVKQAFVPLTLKRERGSPCAYLASNAGKTHTYIQIVCSGFSRRAHPVPPTMGTCTTSYNVKGTIF